MANFIGIDLFSGAGGLSLGAEKAGIKTYFSLDNDPYVASTYKKNFPKVKFYNQDIRDFSYKPISKRSYPVILFGGPPCQGFSTSNQKTRTTENENNWLFKDFFRLVKAYDPEWVVFENVKGIKETCGGIFLQTIQDTFEQLGYKIETTILNARDFGVPQNRHRFFLVANKVGKKFVFPKKEIKFVTVNDALNDLPDLDNGASESWARYSTNIQSSYAKKLRNGADGLLNNIVTKNSPLIIERYKHIPQGGNWESIPENLMSNYKEYKRCHTRIYYRLRSDEPSCVIGNFRKNMLIHPIKNRGLSVREAARLQSFPDYFVFEGSIGFQQQQVGNAVPPMLAEKVFKAILKQMS